MEELSSFKKDLLSKYDSETQADAFVKQAVSQAYDCLKDENLKPDNAISLLNEAESLALHIVYALNETGRDAYEQKRFFSFLDSSDIQKIDPLCELYNRIDILELNDALKTYIKLDWLNSPLIEWYLLNAYLKYCIYLNYNQLMSTKIGPLKRLFLSFFDSKISKFIAFKITNISGFCINWLFLPILGVFLVTKGYNIFGLIILAIFGVPFLANLLFIPRRIAFCKAKRDLGKYVVALIALQRYVNSKVFSPTELLNRVIKLETEHNALVQEIRALCTKMQLKNKEIFII